MNIQIIDFQDSEVASKFVASIKTSGFAVLRNVPHVSQESIAEVYRDFKVFFTDEAAKNSLKFDAQKQLGYFPFKSEKAKDALTQDLKEFFHYFPNRSEAQRTPCGWVIDELCFALEDLGVDLLKWLHAAYPEAGSDWLHAAYSEASSGSWANMVSCSPSTLFRVIHYPPLDGSEEAEAVRSAAHEDINFITLLPAATQSGLQVKDRAGNWHDVPTDSDCIVVNVGDMLQLLTKGFYPSTTHRVVNPQGENVSRYSMPLFIHPHPETQLSEEKTAKQYLNERLKELGLI